MTPEKGYALWSSSRGMLQKIISGGQTGADQGGLQAAVALEVGTGGWAPLGWRTEAGRAPWLGELGLVQHQSPDYSNRTRANARDSDGTVWFGDPNSAGGNCTLGAANSLRKPYLVNPDALALRNWASLNRIEVLNVAGNRESTNPGIEDRTVATLLAAFGNP